MDSGGAPPPTSDGGGSSLGGILGALAIAYSAYQGSRNQDKQNRYNTEAQERQNAYNREMADLQYQRDLEMWERQNAYNSPLEQMNRFRAAGLNPYLALGGGNPGNASGGPSAPRVEQGVPEQSFGFNPGQFLMQAIPMYQDMAMRSAQIDNVKANTENVRSRTINEAMRNFLMDLQQRTGEFNLETKQQMRPYQMQTVQNAVERSSIQVKSEWQRLALLKQQEQMGLLSQQAARQRMLNVDIDIEKNKADLLFAKYRNDWMKMGVTSGDNALLRIFVRMLNQSGLDDAVTNFVPSFKF